MPDRGWHGPQPGPSRSRPPAARPGAARSVLRDRLGALSLEARGPGGVGGDPALKEAVQVWDRLLHLQLRPVRVHPVRCIQCTEAQVLLCKALLLELGPGGIYGIGGKEALLAGSGLGEKHAERLALSGRRGTAFCVCGPDGEALILGPGQGLVDRQ